MPAAADGHSIDGATRLDTADEYLDVAAYDLILLNLMLPDGRWQSFLRALGKRGDVTPVIILTARSKAVFLIALDWGLRS